MDLELRDPQKNQAAERFHLFDSPNQPYPPLLLVLPSGEAQRAEADVSKEKTVKGKSTCERHPAVSAGTPEAQGTEKVNSGECT